MRQCGWIMLAAALAATHGAAQERRRLIGPRDCAPTPYAPCVPAGPQGQPAPLDPNVPLNPADQPPAANSPFSEALASAGESGTQPPAGYMPGFFGDLIGGPSLVLATVQTQSGFQTRVIQSVDVSQSGGLKVSESDSPRPSDRVYYYYNMYGAIAVAPDDPSVPLLDVHRHVIGFEKTFLGGDASIGMRLPFFSFAGSVSYETGFAGDLSIIAKYALVNNRRTGNVLSGGMVITTPTGGSPHFLLNGDRPPSPRNFPVTLQPFAGYIYSPFERLYFHGFHSVAVPTDANEPTFMTNDLGLGFWLFRNPSDQFIRAVVPTVEVHVNTPFDHREAPVAIGQVQMFDTVNLTSGFYIVLPRSTIGCAVGVPLAFGPHKIEALASYSMRF